MYPHSIVNSYKIYIKKNYINYINLQDAVTY